MVRRSGFRVCSLGVTSLVALLGVAATPAWAGHVVRASHWSPPAAVSGIDLTLATAVLSSCPHEGSFILDFCSCEAVNVDVLYETPDGLRLSTAEATPLVQTPGVSPLGAHVSSVSVWLGVNEVPGEYVQAPALDYFIVAWRVRCCPTFIGQPSCHVDSEILPEEGMFRVPVVP